MSNRIFLRFPDFRNKALTLSYDDGVRQDKRLISIMDKHGIKGTFNINAGLFNSTLDCEDKGRMTVEEAVELYKDSVHEVAIHGFRHLSWAMCDNAVVVNDIIKDRIELEKIFGCNIMGMAYPNGTANCTETTVEILKNCNVKYGRTTVSTYGFSIPTDWLRMGATCHHRDPRLMELLDKFLNAPQPAYFWAKAPKLFYLWGHSYEFDNNDNWNVIEEFCERAGGHESVWYATNGEIYDYVTAFDRLEWSVEEKYVYNPSAIDIYIDYYGKQVIVPKGKTITL